MKMIEAERGLLQTMRAEATRRLGDEVSAEDVETLAQELYEGPKRCANEPEDATRAAPETPGGQRHAHRRRALPKVTMTLFDTNRTAAADAAQAPCGSDATWMTLVIIGNPMLVVTHIPMNEVPDATITCTDTCTTTSRCREGPYVNICVEHTEYRPLPLDAVRRLALARLDDPRPRAATTAVEIRCLDT